MIERAPHPALLLARPQIRREVLRDVLLQPICAPWAATLLLLIGSGLEVVRTRGWMTAAIAGVCALATGIGLTVIRHSTRRLRPAIGGVVQWTALLVTLPAVAVLLGRGAAGSFNTSSWTAVAALVPLCLAGTVLTSISVATRRRTIAMIRVLKLRNEQLAVSGQRVQAEAEELRRRVGSLLHGPVQSQLSAAAMVLGLHLHGQTDQPLEEVASDVRRLIKNAEYELVRLADAPPAAPATDKVLASLQRQWRGIIDVQFEVELGRTTQDPALQHLTADLLTDMVSNASRHGHARHVTLQVTAVPHQRILVIESTNDGAPPPECPEPGMLVAAIQARGGSWTCTTDGLLVQVTAVLPIN